MQSIKPFKLTGGEIKLTTATFWRPSGKNLNKASTKGRDEDTWGVTPDKGYLLKLSPRIPICWATACGTGATFQTAKPPSRSRRKR